MSDDQIRDEVAALLSAHRWKSMGVSSVECECGEICYGDESLTQFPADEAFRKHVADALLPVMVRSRDEAYQRGYDDGCDDPDSMWASTKQAFYDKGLAEGEAQVRARVEAVCDEAEKHADTYKRACVVTTGKIRDALTGGKCREMTCPQHGERNREREQ